MTRRVRVSRRARLDLVDILDWTLHTFGPAQARRYEAALIDRLGRIAKGTVRARPLSALTGNEDHVAYGVVRAGAHVLVLQVSDSDILLLRLLHGRRDMARMAVSDLIDPDEA